MEKSTDGNNFVNLTNVPSKGSNNNYHYTDVRPANGNNYYRLTQIDNDGKSKQLGTEAVRLSLETQNFSLYPNPILDNTFYITLPAETDSQVAVSISTLLGKAIYSGIANVTSGRASIILPLKPVSGLYIISIEGKTFKLMVE